MSLNLVSRLALAFGALTIATLPAFAETSPAAAPAFACPCRGSGATERLRCSTPVVLLLLWAGCRCGSAHAPPAQSTSTHADVAALTASGDCPTSTHTAVCARLAARQVLHVLACR